MLELISASGPFGILATALGVVAAALQLAAIVKPERRHLARMALALAASSLFLGITGTHMGMWMADQAIFQAAPEARADLYMRATVVAGTTTTIGAFWATLNAMLFSISTVRARA